MNRNVFQEHIRQTVDGFLQTVVIVDDEAYRKVTPTASDADADAWDDLDTSSPSSGVQLKLKSPAVVAPPDDLSAQKVAEAFAIHGLTCAMLSPQNQKENKKVRTPLLAAARRADLVVLDWNINDDFGETTKILFRGLLEMDRDIERRLRVVAIYTGEPQLSDIADKIMQIAKEEMPDSEIVSDPILPQFTCGPVRVAVLAKEHIVSIPIHLEPQRTTIDDLPSRLADEFSTLCNGLVPSAALAALTGIRRETHRLLTALGPHLDIAFLGHRVALVKPEESERHLESLISAEISAIIDDSQVGNMISVDNIAKWLESRDDLPTAFSLPKNGSIVDSIDIDGLHADFIKFGLSDEYIGEHPATYTPLSKSKLKLLRNSATELFSKKEMAEKSNNSLFEKMAIRTRYSNPAPILTLGSIVRHTRGYAICVQPLCDSTRLRSATSFPFLPLEFCQDGDKGENLIVVRTSASQDRWLTFKIRLQPSELTLVEFEPIEGSIRCTSKKDKSVFVSTTGHFYEWLAELKVNNAQRVVEKLANAFSRVGLDEAELLRLRR
ncbi:response regulator receiver domain [Rhodococcus sp. (in: high G+C Gram-positive bacteria)]|uniref:response regulator receiver domain n=1 Tax=Rhodococcus sp. TaxID=1831 RepID=UPI00257F0243|nr:response regulator receiver domain [Rhodococcus sp. (in: high G+C Gram-positive bacteria)]MBQ7804693.1 hypothetical protein [Rhodococcus sp. (in: high G+C Gram-positive bacteria)]